MHNDYKMAIGLEVHTRLALNSKLFSGASALYGEEPNTCTSFLDAAIPGTLPVLNAQAITLAIKFGLSINAQILNCN